MFSEDFGRRGLCNLRIFLSDEKHRAARGESASFTDVR